MKLEPETSLERHEHPAGEEVWVLEGILEDEDGSYPKGTWLRNPPGSSHAPRHRRGLHFLYQDRTPGSEITDGLSR